MSAAAALKMAKAAGVDIIVDGPDLLLEAPAALPSAVVDEIKRNKAAIIELLRPAGSGAAVLATAVMAASRCRQARPRGRPSLRRDQSGVGSGGRPIRPAPGCASAWELLRWRSICPSARSISEKPDATTPASGSLYSGGASPIIFNLETLQWLRKRRPQGRRL